MLSQKFVRRGELAFRVGGSKATLYGYFASKELLFVEVARNLGERHIRPAFEALAQSADGDVAGALQHLGEGFLSFSSRPDVVAIQRLVIAESGHTSIGRLFFEAGPTFGLDAVAQFMEGSMARGRIRRADPAVATAHLLGLLNAEIMPRCMLGLPANTSRAQIRKIVERAVVAFMAAYAP